MEVSVTAKEKREFLKWFLQHHSTDFYEISWFLEELMVDKRILDSIHFVQTTEDCPKGIIISKQPTEQFSFIFFKGNVSTEDVYTAYHEVHLYKYEKMFIQMNFPGSKQNLLYQSVLEADKLFQRQAKEKADVLLDKLLYEGKLLHLEKEINVALETGNHDAFMMYSNQLKELQELE